MDPKYLRASEVETLLGDAAKARRVLHWTTSYTFDSLVQEMVQDDMALYGP